MQSAHYLVEYGGTLEFAESGVRAFHAHQSKPKRVMKHCAFRHYLDSVAQDALTIRGATMRTVQVSQVHDTKPDVDYG